MIILDATTRKLQAFADATATTTESPIVVSWDDITTTSFTPGASQTITSGNTAVDIVAAPAASTQRAMKFISIYNADTTAHTFTFRYNDNGTTRILFAPLLAIGQSATYCNGQWSVLPTYQSIDPGLCEGRLTLTSGTPVTTSDVTGATTVYFTPYKGNRISLYTNSAWSLYTFTERSVALGTLGSATIPNDIFIYDNSGTLTLEMVAWTSTTARATALVLQDGVLVKSGSTNKRYLGTFAPTATTTTEDSAKNRYLWNYYNRVQRKMFATNTTATWTYTSSTWRSPNGGAGGDGKINFVIGVNESLVQAEVNCPQSATVIGMAGNVGIALDATNTNNAEIISSGQAPSTAGAFSTALARYANPNIGIGVHFLAWVEQDANNLNTITFESGTLQQVAGIEGSIDA